jgi:predicted RNase H-like HicB family nuclease
MRHDYHVVYTTIEDGWIMATVPELPGAVTQGHDLDEARANIKEAVELLLQAYRENAAKDAPARTICDQVGIARVALPSSACRRRRRRATGPRLSVVAQREG